MLLRTLATLADGLDEHMHMVRVADEEAFCIITLNRELGKCLDSLGSKRLYLTRFLQTLDYLFTRGHIWEVHGTYSSLMKRFGGIN